VGDTTRRSTIGVGGGCIRGGSVFNDTIEEGPRRSLDKVFCSFVKFAFVNQTRDTMTDTGFVAAPPHSRGKHQLRVSLFDHQGAEIEHSTSASITPQCVANVLLMCC
jgi:hypothetical protein